MLRFVLPLALGGLVLAGPGCAHVVERRAIEQFAAALEREDLDALRTSTSDAFSHKALRLEHDSLEDLKTLRLPRGETKVVEVQDESDGAKLVTVEAGESKRQLFYRLARKGEKRDWVVDDIYVSQKKQGLKVNKPVTEQMDLLLSIREFFTAWDSDDREQVLAVTTPEFREVLDGLPPVHLANIARRVVGDRSGGSTLRPQPPQMDEKVAIVTVPRKTGKVVMNFRLLDDGWKVSDLAVESRSDGEHIPSVLKMSIALRTAVGFLEAYAAGDKPALSRLATSGFYRGSLLPADLKEIGLPDPDVPDYQMKVQSRRADYLVYRESDLIKLSLARTDEESDGAGTPAKYLVDEVTIYEYGEGEIGRQEKRLSSLFTGRAMVQIFGEALARRDLAVLKKVSTNDFNTRVWNQLDEAALRDLAPIQVGAPTVVGTVFHGAVTEITVADGDRTLTYVLRDSSSGVRIDDVHVATPGWPKSFKAAMELLIPVRSFADALTRADLARLQRQSSADMNRLIWKQTDRVPPLGHVAARHLLAPLSASEQIDGDRTIVTLGDERWGARVVLVNEHARHVVDDVLLIAGPQPEEQARLKRTMRMQLAQGIPRTTDSRAKRQPRQETREPQAAPEDAPRIAAGEEPPERFSLQPSETAFLPPEDEAEDAAGL